MGGIPQPAGILPSTFLPSEVRSYDPEALLRVKRAMDASVSKGHEWSDYDTTVMLDEVYRRRPVLLEMPKQTARHQVTVQVSAQRACEITMQGNAAKLRLAAYAQNVCDMRTLALTKRQHNRHRRAQKQRAKYTERVFNLTTANNAENLRGSQNDT